MIFILQRSCCNCIKALALLAHPQQPLLCMPPPISNHSSARTAPQTEPGHVPASRPESLIQHPWHHCSACQHSCQSIRQRPSVRTTAAISPSNSVHRSVHGTRSCCRGSEGGAGNLVPSVGITSAAWFCPQSRKGTSSKPRSILSNSFRLKKNGCDVGIKPDF